MSTAAEHVGRIEDAIIWAERARYDDGATAEQWALLTVAHMLLLRARGCIVRALSSEPCAACAGSGTVARGDVGQAVPEQRAEAEGEGERGSGPDRYPRNGGR